MTESSVQGVTESKVQGVTESSVQGVTERGKSAYSVIKGGRGEKEGTVQMTVHVGIITVAKKEEIVHCTYVHCTYTLIHSVPYCMSSQIPF